MTEHACTVWEKYVLNSGFKDIKIIAHSAGGWCLSTIQKKFSDTFYDMVGQIALTDSSTISEKELDKNQQRFMSLNALHWVASYDQIGTFQDTRYQNQVCLHLSAGHNKHEYTTGFSWPMIIKFFENDLDIELMHKTFSKS